MEVKNLDLIRLTYSEWRITKELKRFITVKKDFKCLERWLIYMANSKRNSWSNVFIKNPDIKTFIFEAENKKTPDKLRAVVNKMLDQGPIIGKINYSCDTEITCQEFVFPINDRIKFLISKFGCEHVIPLTLRYASIISSGQQWGLEYSFYKKLFDLGFKNEGFASPINSRMLLYGGRFCSLFPDTDKPFGSLGSFFEYDMDTNSDHWFVNPPFVPDLMTKAIKKIIDWLKNDAYPKEIVILLPHWIDHEAYMLLIENENLVHHNVLQNFNLTDSNGTTFPSRVPMTLFYLSTIKARDTVIAAIDSVPTKS